MSKIVLIMIFILILLILLIRFEFFEDYNKVIKKNKINKYTNLSGLNSFKLEEMCLNKLKQNYKCICKNKKNHFPQIKNIKHTDYNVTLTLNDMGTSFNNLSNFQKKKFKKVNFDEQIDCILKNLKRAKVYHSDMHPDGRNLIINDNGDLGLIDYNIAYTPDFKPTSSTNTKRIHKPKHLNTYQQFNKILIQNGLK